MVPKRPSYWGEQLKSCTWDPENYNKNFKCQEPWLSLHFNPVLDDKNAYYVGVCNRIELLKIKYREISSSKDTVNKIWNHQVLQYLRETVNSEKINPACKYCKNYSRENTRNIDQSLYTKLRDDAVKKFFNAFHEKYRAENIDGVELLGGNPSPDEQYQAAKK